jgi:hypothetical protein
MPYPNGKPFPLHVPTADNTLIHASTNYFTADDACLVNGGGAAIPTGNGEMAPAYSITEQLPAWYFPQYAGFSGRSKRQNNWWAK